jgi:hypothetical protein
MIAKNFGRWLWGFFIFLLDHRFSKVSLTKCVNWGETYWKEDKLPNSEMEIGEIKYLIIS